MLKKILIGLAAVVAIFVAVVALQPSHFRVERSAMIEAPAERVFSQVNNFCNWEDWSPWVELDPNANVAYDGPESGEDAIFSWDGNSEVGKGRMTLTESRPDELIRIKLDFEEPMEGTSMAEFTFKPQGEGTHVTWAMFGENNFIARAICLVMNQDEMIGGHFEKGLANLGTIVEKTARAQ